MSEADRIIEEDKINNPNCSYSISSSESCSLQNGSNFVCEAITRIMRNCPRETSKEIFRKTETKDQDGLPATDFRLEGKGIFLSPSPTDIFGLFGDFFKDFEDSFNIHKHHRFSPPPPPPPSNGYAENERSDIIAPHSKRAFGNDHNVEHRGRIQGPVEKI
jgi:hypothetical protein